MPIASVRATFGLENCRDVLHKLEWEIQKLKDIDGTDVDDLKFTAFNACVTGWAIKDWVCKDATEDQARTICEDWGIPEGEWTFMRHWFAQLEWLEVCREIANASKHGGIDDRHRPNVDIDTATSAARRSNLDASFGSIVALPETPTAPSEGSRNEGPNDTEIAIAVEELLREQGTIRWELKVVYCNLRTPIIEVLERVLDFWTGVIYWNGIAAYES